MKPNFGELCLNYFFHLVFQLIGSVFKTETDRYEDIGMKQTPQS